MLSDSDFKALAASPSRLTPSAFSTLTPVLQNSVCGTRAFLDEIDAKKGAITEVKGYTAKYLTSAEKERVTKATMELSNKIWRAGNH